jgi:hypothetical protein
MSETSVSAEMMPKPITAKILKRQLQIAYSILKNTKAKLDHGRLISDEYEILVYIYNRAWIQVAVQKKEEEIVTIKDTGNIAKIIKHIRIAIS